MLMLLLVITAFIILTLIKCLNKRLSQDLDESKNEYGNQAFPVSNIGKLQSIADLFDSYNPACGTFKDYIANKLSRLPDEYAVFDDLQLKDNGHQIQIDHVVVSPYGIFVIESKPYYGCIIGEYNSQYWTQILNRKTYYFYNPIKLNERHIKHIQYLLKDITNIPFIPIVIFNDTTTLKINANNHIVIKINELSQTIHKFKFIRASQTKVKLIENIIRNNCKPTNKNNRKNMQ